jgi:hypothetical protein
MLIRPACGTRIRLHGQSSREAVELAVLHQGIDIGRFWVALLSVCERASNASVGA